jgi:hypothetical protein
MTLSAAQNGGIRWCAPWYASFIIIKVWARQSRNTVRYINITQMKCIYGFKIYTILNSWYCVNNRLSMWTPLSCRSTDIWRRQTGRQFIRIGRGGYKVRHPWWTESEERWKNTEGQLRPNKWEYSWTLPMWHHLRVQPNYNRSQVTLMTTTRVELLLTF